MLDNPMWGALTTRQAHLALGDGPARRYPADLAPFLAVADPGPEAAAAAAVLAPPGESLIMVGVVPPSLPGWTMERLPPITQMVFGGRIEPMAEGPDVSTLGADDADDMLRLMSEVYPGYFRPRTYLMGMYLGVRRNGRLIAMAGQRLHLDGYREISGVATLPDHRGRGYAGRLVARLIGEILHEGLTPFLHVDADNRAARSAYEKVGFVARRDLALARIERRA